MATSTALGRLSIFTRKPFGVVVITAPASTNFASGNSKWFGFPPFIVISPCVIAAAKAQVPATIRSGRVACEVGLSFETPAILIVGDPKPTIFAPIEIKNSPRSTTSGSRAALSIVVTPLAKTAAVIKFSVAPTLGKSRVISAPFNPFGASAMM